MAAENNETTTEDPAQPFMLAEYETLRQLGLGLDSLGESRLNFFLAAISGSLVGLALLNQISSAAQMVYFIDGAVIVGLLAFGFVTFTRMVERSIKKTQYSRGMNRIRRYFADHHPQILPYLMLPISDDTPSLKWTFFSLAKRRFGFTGLAPMVSIINGILATVGVTLLLNVILGLPYVVWLFGSALTFLVVVGVQMRYLKDRFEKASGRLEIHFPSTNKAPSP